MSFLTINGLDVDAYYDNFHRTYKDLQTFDRSEGMTFEGALYASKREWSFDMPWETSSLKAIAVRDWIKGRGHYWTFERGDGATTRFNKYSAEGGPGFGTNISGYTPSKFGSWAALVPNNLTSTVTATFGSEGRYSAAIWKRDSTNTYIHTAAVYDGATLRYYAGAAGVTTAWAWGSLTAASGFLTFTLQGKDQSGSAATALYDGAMLLPYALTTTQIIARNARTTAEPNFPYVEAIGDFNEDLNPITLKCFVDDEPMKQATVAGTAVPARMLKIHLVEK
jgi:hypothetical protein